MYVPNYADMTARQADLTVSAHSNDTFGWLDGSDTQQLP
jgi:hypothetical protein